MARLRTKVPHPSSRKAQHQISKKHHNLKILKRKRVRKSKDMLKRNKLQWFKDNIPQDKDALSVNDLRSMISRYLCRFKLDNKEEEKEAENCSISVTVDAMNEILRQEAQEFATIGLSVPDLTSKRNFDIFKNWNGEIHKMIAIPMILVKKS